MKPKPIVYAAKAMLQVKEMMLNNLFPDKPQAGVTNALLSTIPRSGTWYTRYFFRFYHEYLLGRNPGIQQVNEVVTDARRYSDFSQTLGFSSFHMDHFTCPGFAASGLPEVEAWNALVQASGRGPFEKDMQEHFAGFSPEKSDNRLIFIYRHPFSQYLSTVKGLALQGDSDGVLPPFNPQWPVGQALFKNAPAPEQSFQYYLEGFRKSNLMEAWLIHFVSFHAMRRQYPGRILMVPFEEMMQSPKSWLLKMLAFIGQDTSGAVVLDAANRAEEAVRKDRMKAYEAELGHSIADSPRVAQAKVKSATTHTHMREYTHGAWQTLYTREDAEYVSELLARFAIAPKDISQEFAEGHSALLAANAA